MSSEPESIPNANNDVAKEKLSESKADSLQEEKAGGESVQKSNAMENNKDSAVENDAAVQNNKESKDEKDVKENSVKAEENDVKEKPDDENKGDDSENENDKTASSNDSGDVKKEEDDDGDDKPDTEDTEGTEEENDDKGKEKDKKKKDVPLLDQPLEKSGTRERKKVQRFNEEFNASEKEPAKLEIPEGSGQQLGEIPRIDASISRFKTDDLKILHKILFKMTGKTALIKKNIRKFNGFDFTKDSEHYQKKLGLLQKMEVKQLKSVCEMLDLEKKGNREEIAQRVCDFLVEPKDSGKPVAASGRPKRSAAIKANNRGYSSHEDFSDDDGPPSKRPQRAIRGKGKRPNLKDESSSNESGGDAGKGSASENEGASSAEEMPKVVSRGSRGRGKTAVKKPKKDSDSEEFDESEGETSEDDSDEPKSKRRRSTTSVKSTNSKSKRGTSAKKSTKGSAKKPSTPAKSKKVTPEVKRGKGRRPASKRDESSNEDSEAEEKASSSEDEPLMKKSKSPQPPTDEEIKSYVKEILEGANLEEITMKTVCKQVYAHYPDFDLAHKKDFIKTTVKSLIST